jgi:hypothetical protein
MRVLIVLAALGVAAPAAAQDFHGLAAQQEASRIAEAQALRSRDITITNDLSTLQSRVQSNQTLNDIAGLRGTAPLPTIPLGPYTPPPKIDTSKLATIPDATLAQSNARVRAAADNRR